MSESSTEYSGWTGLIVPAALGCLAAFFYYTSVSQQLKPTQFAALVQDIKPGEVFSSQNFEPVSVWGNTDSLRRDAILWRDLSTIVGVKASRFVQKGSLVVRNDLNLDFAEKAGR